MDLELLETEKKEKCLVRSWKIPIYPNKDQRNIFNKYLGAYRFTYNECVAFARKNWNDKNFPNENKAKQILRRQIVNNTSPFVKKHKWLRNSIISDFRDEAMRDFLKAIKTSFALKRNGHIKHFKINFKRKKTPIQSFSLPKKHWIIRKRKGYFPSRDKIPFKGALSNELLRSGRLVRNQVNQWFICMPKSVLRHENQVSKNSMVAIDPGERTFLTCYDPSGVAFEIARYDSRRTKRLCKWLDILNKKINSLHGKKNYKRKKNMRKAAKRIRLRIKELILEVHKKACKFLCENYKFILLPDFKTQNMVQYRRGRSRRRRLNRKISRSLMLWSHYKFKERLKNKSEEYGNHIISCTEEYTSKTCTNCGFIKSVSGKTKSCQKCKIVYDRDIGAARNILMKYLKDVIFH